ncbi:uncharacterized protein LOC129718241 [Wyeomyia smithii]|uniref:uncharacterized protein LOC129718241 n=1 Tax=Wyeomyia smithii TaxID=174621 RepID=UPI002467D8C5|nr:uncharacterized protein LOC129718241 [Wyeomyia smithii]
MFFILVFVTLVSTVRHSSCFVINADIKEYNSSSAVLPVINFRDCFNSVGLVDCFKNITMRCLNNAINSNVTLRIGNYMAIKKNPVFLASRANEPTPVGWTTILAKLRDFISSRTVQLSLLAPDGRSLIPLSLEGRGKKHKHKQHGGMYMMGGVAFMAMMAQLVLGKVALLAAVALIMAKIALIFSTLNGFKKAAAGAVGGGAGTEHVVYEHSSHGSGGGGSGWQRSIEPKRQSGGLYEDDDLPYRRKRPEYDYKDLEGA